MPVIRNATDSDRPQAGIQKPKTKPSNPLQAGFVNFVEAHGPTNNDISAWSNVEDLLSRLPKRYTLYPPLLLLPANVFTATPAWKDLHAALSLVEREKLYFCIADAFKRQGLGVTHIAINAPIAAKLKTDEGEISRKTENVMRSPMGLVPLHGDWGPSHLVARPDDGRVVGTGQPAEEDFESAFWVSAVQNGGVVQVWAPLWTMFSRGNVKEKARILGRGEGGIEGLANGSENGLLGQELYDISVVDLFVGIGYFAFSYLKRGVGLVWGWEINGWSVEGLRRGCKRNGWRVVRLKVLGDGHVVDEHGRAGDEALRGLAKSFGRVLDEQENEEKIRCVIFQGDNKWSEQITTRLREISSHEQVNTWKKVRHVNLGLLPHARDSWQTSVKILDSVTGGWLHVHENVNMKDLKSRRVEIVREIGKLVAADVTKRGQWETSCCHLEEVKTYAPGVMHCVFDIHILPARWQEH